MKLAEDTKGLNFAVLMLLAIVWGASFLMMKRGLMAFSAVEVATLRNVAAFLTVVPFIPYTLKTLRKGQWKYFMLVALFGNLLPTYLFAEGMTRVDSFVGGILNSLVPLFTLLIGIAFYRMRSTLLNIAGLVLATYGTYELIKATSQGAIAEVSFLYSFYIILATVCYAINLNVLKTALNKIEPLALVVVPLILVGPPSVLYLFTATDFMAHYHASPVRHVSLVHTVVLGSTCSALAPILFNRLIRVTSALFGASVTYLMPVVALILGVVDGEVLRSVYLVWIGLVLAGVFLVSIKKRPEIVC